MRPSSSAAIPPSAARSNCSPGPSVEPDLIDDPRFVDVRSRLANFALLRDEILATAATIADAEQFERQFAEHRLAVGVLRSVRDAV